MTSPKNLSLLTSQWNIDVILKSKAKLMCHAASYIKQKLLAAKEKIK